MADTTGLFPVDIDESTSSNTYWVRGGRYVSRYSVSSKYTSEQVEWEKVRVYVGNDIKDLLSFDLPLREDHPTNSSNPKVKDVLFSEAVSGSNSTDHLASMMAKISEKYNWAPELTDKNKNLMFSYFFLGRTKTSGLPVTSNEAFQKTLRTSFNLRRSINSPLDYVQGACANEYSTKMTSYVSSEFAQIMHYLTSEMGVNTSCNDGSLPFGGKFLVQSATPPEGQAQASHKKHGDGNHIDLRYFSDQGCEAFRVTPDDMVPQALGESVVILDEEPACAAEGSFANYYDIDNAARRIVDLRHTVEFVNNLNQISEANRKICLDDVTKCPQLLESAVQQSSNPEVRQKIVKRNLRAIARLSRWVRYNRTVWTILTSRFKRLHVLISFGSGQSGDMETWQYDILKKGSFDGRDLLIINEIGGLSKIGPCDQTSGCNLVQSSPSDWSKKNLRNDSKGRHLDHLHLGLYNVGE